MLGGVLVKGQVRQHTLTVSGSATGPSGFVGGWEGSSTSRQFSDYVNPAGVGVYLYASSGTGAGAASSASLAIPLLGISRSWTSATLFSSLTTYVQFEGLDLIMLSTGRWRIQGTAIKWYVNGALQYTHGSFTVDSPMFPMPAAIPLFGVPPEITSNASASPVGFLGCGATGTGVQSSATASGGWRYDDGAGWVEPDVSTPTLTPISGSPTMGSVSGTTTWNCSASTQYENTTGGDFIDTGAWIMTVPDLPKGVQRVAKGEYAALILRYGFPAVPVRAEKTVSNLDCFLEDTGSSATTSDAATLPSYSEFLGIAEGSAGDIDDPFLETIYAPCGIEGIFQDSQVSAVVETSGIVTFGPTYTASGDEIPSLTHPYDWRAWYINLWGCPGWSFFPYFPADGGGFGWEAFGSDVDAGEYWILVRQQMLDHPSLDPADARPGERTHLISDCLNQNGLTGLVQSAVPAPLCSWWGVTRFISQEWADYLAASVALDTAGLWTFPGGSGTGGATGTLDAGTTVCEVDIAEWQIDPYRTGEGAVSATVLAPTNVDSWELFLYGADNAKVSLGTSAGTLVFPHNVGRKGFSSTVEDFGAGYATDSGVDEKPIRMRSAASMADSELIGAPGLLPLRQGVKLRLEVVPTDTGDPVTWDAPVLNLPDAGDLKVYPERASAWTVLSADDPGTRWGGQSAWNYAANSPAEPPIVRSPDLQQTAFDWLTLRRRRLQGLDYLDGIDAEIAGLFVLNEEYTQRAHLARDPDEQILTLAPVVEGASGPATWLINSYRETPPLCQFPNPNRDANWQPDYTDPCLYSWSAAEARHYSLMPTGATEPSSLRLYAGGSGPDLFDASETVSGWLIRYHSDDTLNDAATYEVGATWDSADQGVHALRRWRGGLYVPFTAVLSFPGLAYAWHPAGHHARAVADENGALTVAVRTNESGATWNETPAGLNAFAVSLAWLLAHNGPRVLMLTAGPDGTRLHTSDDLAGTWTLAATLDTPADPLGAAITVGADGQVYCYWLDGTTVKGAVLDTALTSLRTDSSIRTSVDPAGIAAAAFIRGQVPRIALLTVESSAVTITESTDGLAFS